MHQIIKKQIEELQTETSKKIEWLNSGGCIRFAYYMSRKLHELNINHSICYRQQNYLPLKLTKNQFVAVSHVFIYIPKIGYFDGYEFIPKGNIRPYGYKYKNYKSPLSSLEYYIYKRGWNTLYNSENDELLVMLIDKYITYENRI